MSPVCYNVIMHWLFTMNYLFSHFQKWMSMLLKHKFMQEVEDLGILTMVSKVEYT
jgi:hypothetical protein